VIRGAVSGFREAILSLAVRGPQAPITVDAVVDTGFTDYLTLPQSAITALALPFGGTVRVSLAGQAEAGLDAYLASVLWDGVWRSVMVLAAEGEPLVGMALLYGFSLWVEVIDGGAVTIQRLP
jgi:clan AA aspartic protease